MYHVSAQGVDERMINIHYYYKHTIKTTEIFQNRFLDWKLDLVYPLN